MSDGHVIDGAWLPKTVTVKEQVAVFPLTSVAVLVTVVVPKLNVLPEAGLDIVVEIEQLSVDVTLKVTTALQFPIKAF